MANFSKIELNQYAQVQCFGCREIGPLFIQAARLPGASFGSIQIHRSFGELSACAQKCVACQVFRRGLLLKQITVQDCKRLFDSTEAIRVILKDNGDGFVLHVSVGSDISTARHSAIVLCTKTNQSLRPRGMSTEADWNQLKTWISGCDKDHTCKDFRWSNNNPSWLIKILPRDQIQLVRGSDISGKKSPLVRYVALSYCWGHRNNQSNTEKEEMLWDKVDNTHTRVLHKGQPLLERLRPFQRSEYPAALHDAINITEKLGIEYIWIDNVCIPDQDDWNVEAGKMHEVYGNAYLTLFACSSDKAIDPLSTHRSAWDYPVKSCRIFGHWLTNQDPTLSEVRLRNPLSRRGWILQEERLSPRILFWCAQRAYWSCCERQGTESRHTDSPSASQAPRPQQFMRLCRSGDNDILQEHWLDLVASYTRRNLSEYGKEKDRFKCMSGLAVRYLSSGDQAAPQRDEYLAGLWRRTFARDLAWRPIHAVLPENNLRKVAPTWSWASVPLCTDVDLQHEFQTCPNFRLLEPTRVTSNDNEQDVVTRGASVRSVHVTGRLRRLIMAYSIVVPWDAVVTKSDDGTDIFQSPLDPSQAVHARNLANGRLLIYEPHKAETICQLDYLEAEQWDEKPDNSATVPHGAEIELFCLEIGVSSMLLLQRVPCAEEISETSTGTENSRYRRAGIGLMSHASLRYRKNFFEGYDIASVVLE